MSAQIEMEGKPLFPRDCLSAPCRLRSEVLKRTIRLETLEKQLENVRQENMLYKNMISKLFREINELLEPDNAAISFLKEQLVGIPIVNALSHFFTEDIINLWIIIKHEDFELEMDIAEQLSQLFRIFKNLRFTFRIVPLGDANLEEILPSSAVKNIYFFSR